MMMKPVLLVTVILMTAPAASLAQSQTGNNYGVPYSGAAINRSNGSGYVHSRHRESRDQDSHSSGSGGQESDARDAGATTPVARQASTPK